MSNYPPVRGIVFDLDGTLDKDPQMWAEFADIAIERGHNVYLVTCRRNTAENREIVAEFCAEYQLNIPSCCRVFTDLGPKRDYMAKLGITIHVWVDDDPACIIFGK